MSELDSRDVHLVAHPVSYMMNSKLWDWIPDLRDACIPFMIGALELFLNHSISVGLSAWLFTLAIIAGMVRGSASEGRR
jgi:hypothetical protein